MVILIATCLTKETQGFYYTFLSIAALQVFFDIGFAYVTVQFVAHEFATLFWSENGKNIFGPETSKDRFYSICDIACKWYYLSAFLCFWVLLLGGFCFFLKLNPLAAGQVHWSGPWILNAFAISISLLITPLFAIVEGSGKVYEANKMRLVASICGSLAGWGVLFFGGQLYAIGTITLVRDCLAIAILAKSFHFVIRIAKSALLSLLQTSIWTSIKSCFAGEMWAMQWKIALSWMSGYFIFQLYSPLAFYYDGPVAAGEMGMTMSIANSIGQLSLAWLISYAPMFARYIAEQNWQMLDRSFFAMMWKSSAMLVALLVSGVLLIEIVFPEFNFRDRVLSTVGICIVFATTFINHLINCFAVYLRAYKKEPLLLASVAGAIFSFLLMTTFGSRYGVYGIITCGFSLAVIYGLPVAFWIWIQWRRKFNHSELVGAIRGVH